MKRKKKSRLKRMFWVSFFTVAAGAFCAMAAYLFIIVSGDRYLNDQLGHIEFKETTILYDRNNNEAARLFVENREYVPVSEMPELIKQAFIATEDKRFAQHEGIDYFGIGRAIVKDIIARKAVEGASTITQQLARNLFLSNEKTFFRKATELSIATALESKYTKDQILEMYLNRIFFGKAAYGIQAAAKTYFGKDDLNDLELHEIAVLAGIPKAPGYYNPIDHPDQAKRRRDTVLALMAQQGVITEQEKEQAQSMPVESRSYETNVNYPSFVDYVMQEVQETTGITEEQLFTKGYQIYTTLDVDAQKALEEAYGDAGNFPKDGPEQKVQSSLVILDNANGGIAAMIGGRDYIRKGLNRAVEKRQPGSAFKPIAVFAPAIETGEWNPYSKLSNEKQSFNGYSPSNLNGAYSEKVTMMEAARKSINVPTVWLLNEIGVKTGMNFASKLGMELDKDDRNLSIALGGLTSGVSPLEMARAYSAFAADGILNKPHAIVRITDKKGNVVYSFDVKKNQETVMSEKTAWYTTLLLKEVVASGTGTKAKIKNHDVAGKTGTTQSGIEGVKGNRDIWFVGYTQDYTAAVWMGFDKTDKQHVMADYSGTAAALFSKVMGKALSGSKSLLVSPKGVPELKNSVDPITGLTAVYSAERNHIELQWTALEGQYEYRLFRKSADEEKFAQLIATDKVSVIDLIIEPGKTYQYYVTAYDPMLDSESEPSATVEAVIEAAMPPDEAEPDTITDSDAPEQQPAPPDEGESEPAADPQVNQEQPAPADTPDEASDET